MVTKNVYQRIKLCVFLSILLNKHVLFCFSGFNMQQVPVSTHNSGVPAVSILLVNNLK